MTPLSGRCAPAHTLLSDFWEIHSFFAFAQQQANSPPGWSGDRTAEGSEGIDGCGLGVGTVNSGVVRWGRENYAKWNTIIRLLFIHLFKVCLLTVPLNSDIAKLKLAKVSKTTTVIQCCTIIFPGFYNSASKTLDLHYKMRQAWIPLWQWDLASLSTPAETCSALQTQLVGVDGWQSERTHSTAILEHSFIPVESRPNLGFHWIFQNATYECTGQQKIILLHWFTYY